jgi:hypothetical protein
MVELLDKIGLSVDEFFSGLSSPEILIIGVVIGVVVFFVPYKLRYRNKISSKIVDRSVKKGRS